MVRLAQFEPTCSICSSWLVILKGPSKTTQSEVDINQCVIQTKLMGWEIDGSAKLKPAQTFECSQ